MTTPPDGGAGPARRSWTPEEPDPDDSASADAAGESGASTPPEAAGEPAPPAEPGPAETEPVEHSAPDSTDEGHTVLDMSTGKGVGLDKCPKCGATEVEHLVGGADLRCSFCRHTWTPEAIDARFGLSEGIESLRGFVVSTGSSTITDTESLVTLSCSGCGAEVVIDTDDNLASRCHWCRSTLSIEAQIPNGAVPDGILPFTVPKEDAVKRIADFVHARRMFADSTFKKEFTTDNVLPVYLPYLVVDGNIHAQVLGEGEITDRTYLVPVRRGHGKDARTTYERRYDFTRYAVVRDFDLHVDDLMIESSEDFAGAVAASSSTTNIVNSLLPYDVKNMVAFDTGYMRGCTSEKRDLDVKEVAGAAGDMFLSIARAKADGMTAQYDRGVRWDAEKLLVKGSRWVSVLLPVWLYSYRHVEGGRPMVHYVAVNGRNGQTMGSVPVNKGKIVGAAFAVGVPVTAITMPLGLAAMASA
ncbi:hypothetical protein [Demequina pelophila]|uniref:hypothetical protein n=1 Tax=Demequina pelophila TaxID=1638984 RepID=UPI0007814217|nr:hypothetical protein [Demequina pelophila]